MEIKNIPQFFLSKSTTDWQRNSNQDCLSEFMRDIEIFRRPYNKTFITWTSKQNENILIFKTKSKEDKVMRNLDGWQSYFVFKFYIWKIDNITRVGMIYMSKVNNPTGTKMPAHFISMNDKETLIPQGRLQLAKSFIINWYCERVATI